MAVVKDVTFDARITGDGECFCWEVDEETYKKIKGSRFYEQEIEDRNLFIRETKEHFGGKWPEEKIDKYIKEMTSDRFFVYPDSVLKLESDKKYRFRIVVTEI